MLPAKRRARIIETLRRDRIASLTELADMLGASLSTTRRDIDFLAEAGHVVRTHGGAMLDDDADRRTEPGPEISSEIERAAKARIGTAAAALIRPGQTVIFDSGTTTAACARAAAARHVSFTTVTNDIGIAATFAQAGHIECHLTAGRLRTGSGTLLGPACTRDLSRLRADLVFVGAHAVDASGLSDTSIDLAEVKRALIAAAETVVLLVDSSKFLHRAFCLFAEHSAIDRVVTDSRITSEALRHFAEAGVPVDVVDPEGALNDA